MKPEDYSLIEEYLDGRLSPEARAELESRLATDQELAAALSLRREMNRNLMKRDRRIQLKTTLDELGDEFFGAEEMEKPSQPKVKRLLPRRSWLAYAAAVAVLVTAGLALYFNWRPSLYDRHAQHPPLALVQRSAQSDALATRSEQYFNAKDYENAYQSLGRYIQIAPDNKLAKLYLGISALETDRFAEAQKIFTELRENGDQWQDYAQWYLALNYLKQGDRTASRNALNQINSDSEWYENAQVLLKKLGGG